MKQSITLLDIGKLPDAQIHSKYSFFKAMISNQPPEVLSIRSNIAKLSYTIKTIGVKDEEVGIITKRVPLKSKFQQYSQQNTNKQANHFNTNFVPHKSFYSAGLIPVKKLQLQPEHNIVNPQAIGIQVDTRKKINTQQTYRVNTGLRAKQHSLSKVKLFKKNSSQKQLVSIKWKTGDNTKSYSKMLRQLSNHKPKIINSLSHQQNPLFKKIKKINNLIKINQHNKMHPAYLANVQQINQ